MVFTKILEFNFIININFFSFYFAFLFSPPPPKKKIMPSIVGTWKNVGFCPLPKSSFVFDTFGKKFFYLFKADNSCYFEFFPPLGLLVNDRVNNSNSLYKICKWKNQMSICIFLLVSKCFPVYESRYKYPNFFSVFLYFPLAEFINGEFTNQLLYLSAVILH